MLDPLKSRYRTLLGVDESWLVTNVSLDVAAKRVTIALEFVGNRAVCPECSSARSLADWQSGILMESAMQASMKRALVEARIMCR